MATKENEAESNTAEDPNSVELTKSQARLNERIRMLIRQSKEQGYLTYKDINKSLPESVNNPDEIENVISILENLEVDILDDSEVETYKARMEESESGASRCCGSFDALFVLLKTALIVRSGVN